MKKIRNSLKALPENIIFPVTLGVLTVILTGVLIFALTVAWQTNVVQSDGLTFTAEKWNFTGEVTIDGTGISAAPGDSGVIPITMSNTGEEVVAASVTVSKNQFSDDAMKQRLYFYVDTQAVRNGETLDKVYISNCSSYTYTVFPQCQLLLTETSRNAPLVKWQWVYDVLGYYVVGTGTAGTNGTAVTVEEYIRPVEYDYDETKTTFDENGNLETVDGKMTVQEFLYEISLKDGYKGTIDVNKVTPAGYYPVDVDEKGYGVWIYLCTYSEIQKNTETDTEIGTAAEGSYVARITVTGNNSDENTVTVGDEEAFEKALESQVSIIKLSENLDFTETLTVKSGSSAMIKLEGYTISSEAETMISAETGSTVMVSGGSLVGSAETDVAVAASGSDVTLYGVTVSDVNEGIAVFDHKNGLGEDSRVKLINCNVTARMDGLWIYGNGDESQAATEIVIENCTIKGEQYAGILCNGSEGGTDIKISDSNISGKYTSIYHPQADSTMTVENCTLTGWTGLVVKGGTVNVIDSAVRGTGTYKEPEYESSGWTDTGDGIYVEANYDREIVVNILGENTSVSSTEVNTLAVRKYMADADNAAIAISGGTFSSDVSSYLDATAGAAMITQDGKYVVTVP